MVWPRGLEPPWVSSLASETSASTNSAMTTYKRLYHSRLSFLFSSSCNVLKSTLPSIVKGKDSLNSISVGTDHLIRYLRHVSSILSFIASSSNYLATTKTLIEFCNLASGILIAAQALTSGIDSINCSTSLGKTATPDTLTTLFLRCLK